ncbi:alpha/beta hydrolase [Halosegnis longus]|uniref:Alpha/beta fold hydrolase n=1 Tax=Halosegnis longus TaxID=2216012 RepID=A0AAJ4UW91_9EURY|nr:MULTISPECIES: alpha/beta fold hydrolase [Halobacteriales]RNJ26857.1 alpha/beta fold hydrolase [Salella cibi]
MSHRRDVETDDGTRIAIHARRPDRPAEDAVVFVHGATFGARPAFDTPGYSWLADTASRGRAAYAVDAVGYGDSDRPAAMDDPAGDPPSRADRVADDLRRVLDSLARDHDRLHLVGYSWGTMVAGLACTRGTELSSLVQFAPVYDPDPARVSAFDPGPDPAPKRETTRANTRDRWDAHLPTPSDYRDPDAFDRFWTTLFDGQGVRDDPPTVEAPNGTLLDLTAAATEGPIYDAGGITVPTLVVRGSLDRTATRADGLRLYDDLAADDAEYAEIANGSHFLAIERRREALFDRVAAFHDRQ